MSCDRTYGEGLYGECVYGGAEPLLPGYVSFPRANFNYLSTPDEPALEAAKLTIIMKARSPDWMSVGNKYLASRMITSAVFRLIIISATGSLYFGTYDNASVETTINVAPPGGFVTHTDIDGWVWLAASKDPDNGLGQRVSRLYVSTDGVTWNNYASSTIAGATNIRTTSPSPLEIGATSAGQTWDGDIAYLSVRDGVGAGGTLGGVEVFRYDARTDLIGVAPDAASFTAFTGQTITAFHSGGDPLVIVPTTGSDCEPCYSNVGCPEQIPLASGPRDRFADLVPCPPGGDC